MKFIAAALSLIVFCLSLGARSVEFEYGLNLMDGILVRQTYAGIVISVGQPVSDRTKYLIAETNLTEMRRNKIMTFSYKYRLWPIKPRLNELSLKNNVLNSRDIVPVFNLNQQFSFYVLNERPRGRFTIKNQSSGYPGWPLEFDFAPFSTGKYELVYGSAEVALQFYAVHDVKVIIDMANDIISINIDNYKVIYRKKLTFYPNCYGFINVPITYGNNPWPGIAPSLEIMDFRVHYGYNDYRTMPDIQYPRFHVGDYERRERHLRTDSQFWQGLCYYEGSYGARKDFVEAAGLFTKAAKDDHVLAQYYLGLCYLYGRGVKQSNSEAYSWFRKAAREYHDGACLFAAMMLCTGRHELNTSSPNSTFSEMLSPAILQGNADAFYLNNWRVGAKFLPSLSIVAPGDGAARRGHPKALLKEARLPKAEYFRRCETLAVQDFVPAIVAAGECLMSGYGTAVDFKRGFEFLRKAADMGSDRAALSAGKCYLGGVGVNKDLAEAEKLLRPLEYKGFINAQLLAGFFEKVPDPGAEHALAGRFAEAFKFWSQSSEPTHLYRAGLCLADGTGTKQDYKLAFDYFTKAAASGLPQAYLELAECYTTGNGVSLKNPNTAFDYYRRSAAYPAGALAFARKCVERQLGQEALQASADAGNAGILEAILLHGRLLLNGLAPRLPNRPDQAIYSLTLAADRGSVEAMLELGNCYYNGIGVKADKNKAAEWWTKYHAASDERDNNEMSDFAPYWKPLPNYPAVTSVSGMPKYVSDWKNPDEIYKYYQKY